MKKCKKCDGEGMTMRTFVFVDRRGVQHEVERSTACDCLSKKNSELLLVYKAWGQTPTTGIKSLVVRNTKGVVRKRAA